jgi:hypothetical protein
MGLLEDLRSDYDPAINEDKIVIGALPPSATPIPKRLGRNQPTSDKNSYEISARDGDHYVGIPIQFSFLILTEFTIIGYSNMMTLSFL